MFRPYMAIIGFCQLDFTYKLCEMLYDVEISHQGIVPMYLCIGGYSGELSYLAPLGSENISAPYFKQCFFPGGRYYPPQTESNTTPPSPKTEITNILFYILNFVSIIKFKM